MRSLVWSAAFVTPLLADPVPGVAPHEATLAPRAPSAADVRRLAGERAATLTARATATPLTVDTASREAVRQFYLAVFSAADGVPLGWTGSHAPGQWGTTSAAFQESVLLRINSLRALAGVPAGVALNAAYSAKAQQAALMMSLNDQLSHYPPSSWTGYTADGADAASHSNLSLGHYGPEATMGQMIDAQANNTAAGHRRWLLYPQTTEMGTGDVPAGGTTFRAANATWVVTGQFSNPRPATRTPYVAWPPRGYIPANLVFPRWSFSYPNANFANAAVTMTRDGAPVAARLETVANGVGDNTLVWVWGGLDSNSGAPLSVSTDTLFRVTVSNVVIGGAAQSFTYDVTAFDPRQTGADTVPVAVNGASPLYAGVEQGFTVSRPAFVGTTQWRVLAFDAAVPVYGAENGLDGVIAATTGSYAPRVTTPVALGSGAYHLAMPDFENQYLTLPDLFYAPAGGSAQLTYRSRLGWATADQIARVQLSTDDGKTWTDLAQRAGTGSAGTGAYAQNQHALAAVAGQTFRVRFAYTFTTGSAFTQTDADVGWLLDGIALSGVQRVANASTPATAPNGGFSWRRSQAGTAALQARGVLFEQYPMGWGPVLPVTVAAGPAFTAQPASQAGGLGANVTLSAATSAASPSFTWRHNGLAVAGTNAASLALANFQPANTGLYTAVVTSGAGAAASQPAIVGLGGSAKVVGAGYELSPNIRHANGNIFDQVLLTGTAETITAEFSPDPAANQITRTSFVDLDGDIVQVEFSGPGNLSLVLDQASGPAPAANYNQPGVSYMRGHAGIVITGADEHTNVSVFTVGRATAVNQTLFKSDVAYDGIADIAFIAIQSANGKFGGVRTANANYFASRGYTGLYAPGVEFTGPVYLGDLSAFDTATPVLILGSARGASGIQGGDLYQDNGEPVQVSGLTRLTFAEGSDSHGNRIAARTNRAVLLQDGRDVTATLVANP